MNNGSFIQPGAIQPCTIQPCTCKHPQQDALHGPQMRVHNPTPKATMTKQPMVVRCTVCGTERSIIAIDPRSTTPS